MKESLEQAKEELIQRFIKSYDELDRYYTNQAQTVAYTYAEIFSYDLGDYKNGKIKPGSKLYKTPPEDGSYGKYGFNALGVLTTAEIYSKGEVVWIAFFVHEENLIEYVEFNIGSGAPSCVKRLVFKEGKKVLYQSCSTNGRGGFWSNELTEREEIVRAGFDKPSTSAICTFEEYHYRDGLIDRAYGLHNMPGAGEWAFEDVYDYTGGKLAEIKSYYDKGNVVVKYVAPSGKSVAALSTELAGKLSDYLITVLQRQNFDGPLFSVELSYQYCYSYWPHIVVVTGEQKDRAIEDKNEEVFINGEYLDGTGEKPAGLEELYTEFYQRLEATGNWEAGRKMLKQAAKLMTTTKLKGLVPVASDFITFPIEWMMDMDRFEKILLACGATKESVKQWKQYGWVV